MVATKRKPDDENCNCPACVVRRMLEGGEMPPTPPEGLSAREYAAYWASIPEAEGGFTAEEKAAAVKKFAAMDAHVNAGGAPGVFMPAKLDTGDLAIVLNFMANVATIIRDALQRDPEKAAERLGLAMQFEQEFVLPFEKALKSVAAEAAGTSPDAEKKTAQRPSE